MKIFVSFCHDDIEFLVNLEKHLAALQKNHTIEIFSDQKIRPGADLHQQINRRLNNANLVLLLISPGFLASRECEKEMKFALKRQEHGEVDVVPIIVHACDWLSTNLASLKALPNDGKPISKWENQHEAYLNVVEGLTKVVLNRIGCKSRKCYIDALQNTGFKSSAKENVPLDDIFITPNIAESTEEKSVAISNISELSCNHGIALLYGDDLCGKSTICKKIYLERNADGHLTLFLNGNDIKKYQHRSEIIEKAFAQQYEGSIEAWQTSNNRTLIIDNFDMESCEHMVKDYEEECESMLLTMSRNKYIAYCRDKEFIARSRLFELNHLTHSQQEKLIRRWKESSRPESYSLTINDGSIDRVETILNSLIPNRRIVPRFPFYVLTILQSLEAFGPENLKINTFGHCYHAFIVFQLRVSGVSGEEIDSIMNFLSFVAFEKFRNAEEENWEEVGVSEIIRKYRDNFVGGERRIRKFVSTATNILDVGDGKISFQHPYIYYFLLGYYFARNRKDFQKFSEKMIANCHTKDNSFALIFAIHNSSDIELIDSLIAHAEGLLEGLEIATLSRAETHRLESALERIPKNVLSGNSVGEERKRVRDHRDQVEEQIDKDEEDIDEADDDLDGIKIYSALKTMDILAQVVLTKYGSLRKETCVELIQSICDLTFKIVKYFISKRTIMALDELALSVMAEELKDDKHKLDAAAYELSRRLRAIITWLVYVVVKKASISIGQAELTEIVQGVCEKRDTTAYWLVFWIYKLNSAEMLDDEVSKILVDAIQECSRERNEVVKRLVSLEVQFYLNSHRVDHRIRQRICGSLGIRYVPNRSL